MLKQIFGALFAMSTAKAESHIIWQGFKHQWERSLVGFNTPHRMGSIQNRIIEKSSEDNEIRAVANFTFTPGVNGDFAHPEAFFQ